MTKAEIEKLSDLQALRRFFEDSRQLTMAELKEVAPEQRRELGAMARQELLSQAAN